MTEKEKLMYDIISKISDIDAPIVFKGALITKLILKENGYNEIQRMTKDIDANWVGKLPTMAHLSDTIRLALGELNEKFEVEESRMYGEGRSAGLTIRDICTGDKIISMDIDIKSSSGKKEYYYGESSIKGVLANDIIADKVCAISSDAVFKHRAKDMVDLYALLNCVDIEIKHIIESCQKSNRQIQEFNGFLHRKDDVEHAYNRLKGIKGKPDFSVVYNYLYRFISPFINRKIQNLRWNSKSQSWETVIVNNRNCEKQSLISKLRLAEKEVCENNQSQIANNKCNDIHRD